MYTLAIIDMQDEFLSTLNETDNVINNCRSQINKAIEDEAHILFVEYEGYDTTTKELVDIVESNKYLDVTHITKWDDNGAEEILAAIRLHLLPQQTIKFCGINTDCCVYSTVKGFLQAMKEANVEVITDACDSAHNHKRGIDYLKSLTAEHPNLKIV